VENAAIFQAVVPGAITVVMTGSRRVVTWLDRQMGRATAS